MEDAHPVRRGLVAVTLLLGAGIVVGSVGLGSGRSASLSGLAWGVVSGVGALAVVGQAWRHRGENRPPTEGSSYDSLGVANGVTLLRGGLVAGLAGLLVVSRPPAWAAALLYGGVAALDALDGTLARHAGRESELGARLDMDVDAAGLLVASIVGVVSGALPPWYLLAGTARYVFVVGTWWRQRAGRDVLELPPSTSRRVLAGVQMAVVPVALAPVVPRTVAWTLATGALAPFLVNFWVDWRVVSGRREEPLR